MKEIIDHASNLVTINHAQTIQDAAEVIKKRHIGCILVVNEHREFVGLVTERDIALWVARTARSADETPVAEIMTANVVSCSPGTPPSQSRKLMATHRIRHLPIVSNDEVVGMLSVRDLMGQQLIEDRAAAEEVAMLSNCLKSIELDEACDIVAKEAPKLFRAQKCMLCLYKDGNTGVDPDLGSQFQCQRAKERFRQTLDSGEMQREDAVLFETVPSDCQECDGQGPRMLIPINLTGLRDQATNKDSSLVGYLCMCGLDETSAANTELISYKAKLAKKILTSHLTNATLYHQARLTSITDALTGIGSRKVLEDNLDSEYVRSQRYESPFSLAIIDLDNFKTVNDVLGHSTGDDALKKLADCMRTLIRHPDILARYGGDEFVILMPETGIDEAQMVMERISVEVRKIRLTQDTPITVSCGVAQSLPKEDQSPSDVMRRADLALYEAKNAGRDCVKSWRQDMTRLMDADDLEIGKVKELQRRVAGLSEKAEKMFMQSIWGLVRALEAKNPYAKMHSENVTHYAMGIAKAMDIGPKHIDIIRRAAMLHDIGKIGIPDAIMSKEGKLTRGERKLMEQHPIIAERILETMNFLEHEIGIVRHHHEKWNGSGYPDGLAEEAIPLGSRILVVADTLDALTSNRSYRASLSLNEAIKLLVDASDYEFDSEVVKAFLCWVEELGKTLGKKPDQMTMNDLLMSQMDDALGFVEPITAESLLEAVKI